jgi:uncharacterized membrane protein YdjX (TVP38/TMEM64 family)
MIAFVLARRYGARLVGRIVPLQKIQKFEAKLSSRNQFWTVVLLRLTVPVDVLSYAIGLFSTMPAKSYLLATTIGVIPFAFIFAYTGTLPPGLQIIVVVEIVLLIILIYYLQRWFRSQWVANFLNCLVTIVIVTTKLFTDLNYSLSRKISQISRDNVKITRYY